MKKEVRSPKTENGSQKQVANSQLQINKDNIDEDSENI